MIEIDHVIVETLLPLLLVCILLAILIFPPRSK